MFSDTRKISRVLISLVFVLTFDYAIARFVKPVTFGYELGNPFNALLPEVSDLDSDLSISAAEPRPVFVEVVKRPQMPVKKIEKVLRRPMAFSYNADSAHAASLIVNSPKEKLKVDETQLRFDQQPDAIDYYKYIARLQGEENGGAALQKENAEQKKEDQSGKKEAAQEEKRDSIISKPNPFHYSPPSYNHDYKFGYDYTKPLSSLHKAETHAPKHKTEEVKKEDKSHDDHKSHASHKHHHYQHHHQAETKPKHYEVKPEQVDVGGKAEASESHEDHKEESHHGDQAHGDNQPSGSDGHKHEEAKEEVQASASHHGDGGGGGNYKKGGGKEHKSEHHGEHGESGEKKYSGHHHHEKGEKGHKDEEGHNNEYHEEEGHKHGHHEEDGYEGEHHHGEEGKKGTEFHEEGEHHKGHSTQGEHNIHKKDEYEKKHEFYDESHEGGEHEKEGEYFHEDEYHKGGHHKSEHKKGGEHEEHYGKEKKHEEGGHEHEDKGHKKADGHTVHHDHDEKHGHGHKHDGGKKWHYDHDHKEGDDDKHHDSKGAHQTVQEVVKDGKAEASENRKAEDSKGENYHVQEISSDKKSQGGHRAHQAQAPEDHKDHHDYHGQHSHDAFTRDSYGDLLPRHRADNSHDLGLGGHAEGHGHSARLRDENAQAPEKNYYGQLRESEARPEKAEEQPAPKKIKHDYAADLLADVIPGYSLPEESKVSKNVEPEHTPAHPRAAGLQDHGSHVHPNGYVCPGSLAHASTTQAQNVIEPVHHAKAEESAPRSHVLVVGNDGNIYGILPNSDNIPNTQVY
ncbi:hypothetical protein NQ315_002216 [Exocentrus adspersus]|uniref:Uncharacterized protein n=1 Tax=Exocentrus adspersus TaxID=1586481 RepID=A0AAV8VZC3_9CUCU|nr:hypothetical protein NQ315_002216 [Exocentrus adspersus]